MSNEILLTGASSCLGLDFIRKIDEKNLPIHAVVRDLKNFIAEIKKNQYQNIISYEFAHENHEEIQSLMQNIFSKGKPNSLVMFNGTHHIKPLRAENFDSINSMFINNVVIPMLIAKEFSKIARKEKIVNASITFISSTAALKGEAGLASYSAAKGALVSLTKSLGNELGNYGIRVNSISPGWIDSKRSEKVKKTIPHESFKSIEKEYLLGLGSPTDISEMAYFLLSEKAKWITGQNFIVDGGFTS